MTITDTTTNTLVHRFAGRTALVTGSTSGIGEAIAQRLADEGAHVLISGRDTDRGTSCVERIRSSGGRGRLPAPWTSAARTQTSARFATDATALLGGRVDILVNNAGRLPVAADDRTD